VAVAVMGLYGASTNCWDMSTHAHAHFDGFWETLAFIVNALVFMYSGASVVNFFIRWVRGEGGGGGHLWVCQARTSTRPCS
jgi:NhaP-type Na+/H+ or K+/H+ antiporter